MLTNLPRRTMSLDAETAEQLHHVMVMFWRRIADVEFPVKQVRVGAIEERLESPELVTIQGPEGVFGERAENEVAFLCPAVPTPKQEAPAADIGIIVILRNSHLDFWMSLKTAVFSSNTSPMRAFNMHSHCQP